MMADSSTPNTNPKNEQSRSPAMFIIMGVIIVLGILAFFLLRSGGTGSGTESSPANPHSLLRAPFAANRAVAA